jgi:hypothetical protein
MPNWCNNKLTVTGPKLTVNLFEKTARGADPIWAGNDSKEANPVEVLCFHSLVAVPEDVLAAGFDKCGYNWCVANWGTKWSACEPVLDDKWDGELNYSFDTAWAPPISFLTKLGQMWSGLTFVLEYEEGGMGFKGICKVAGDKVEDHCINL